MRSPIVRIAVAIGAAAVLVVLFLVLRPDDDDEQAAGTTTTTETTKETTTTTTVTLQIVPRISVTVRGGRVAGGVKTVPLTQGSQVVIVVRADVADQVHVHGYDRMADVGPGSPAQIALRLTIPGRFEVELEDRKLRILELEVGA